MPAAVSSCIHRLTTEYKDIFTSVFLLECPKGAILFDSASYDTDVDLHILPFLHQLGITPEKLKYVFISHNHRDHSGGLPRLLELFPDTRVVSRSQTLQEAWAHRGFLCPEDGEMLLDTYRVVAIPGHTADSAALLDTRTGTLITGDCLQLHGIVGSGDWACNISFPVEHLAAIEKVRTMQVSAILTAHDYVPMGCQSEGKAAVEAMLDACVTPLLTIRDLIRDNPAQDDTQIRELFNRPHLTVNPRVIAAIRKAMGEGTF